MSAHRTPGSRYSGRYKPKKTLNPPGVPRTRVGHYLRVDLDERLRLWCEQECVSKSHIIELLIEQHLKIEDPDSTRFTCFVSEVPPAPKKAPAKVPAFPPTIGDLYPPTYPSYLARLPSSKPTPYAPGYNEHGKMPI
jgi:hypothetical protein